jgi:hypothetical protein
MGPMLSSYQLLYKLSQRHWATCSTHSQSPKSLLSSYMQHRDLPAQNVTAYSTNGVPLLASATFAPLTATYSLVPFNWSV